jgi:nucleotide-binding universal stress UspA family protein
MGADTPGTPPLASGAVIDGFRLGELLHEGAMARLWAATSEGCAAPVPLVIKVPRISGDDPEAIVGFEVEQMILPMLRGVHVPQFIARGDLARQPYLVMERVPAPSLKPRIDGAPLPYDEVADIGARVAAALHDLHRQHVVHLDVKPSNVLFRPTGEAVLVDYGLSRHDRLPDLLDEEFRLPLGTGPYMSPEQLHYVRNDPRSDLFALGVMLYLLATGERPFGWPTTVRGLRRRLYTEAVPPRVLRSGFPPWLQEVILRCLEVDPARRYQTAAQLAADLRSPDQIALTERAQRTARPSATLRVRRWLNSLGREAHSPAPREMEATDIVARNPIVMAAVDIEGAAPELLEQLRETVRRVVQAEPGARLACVSVMKAGRIAMDHRTDARGRSVHVTQLVSLRHWARPIAQALHLGEGRLTFHVLEAPDPAAAIVEFAARSQVDHIVMGARAHSTLRRYLGSVSSQVVAQAGCSVTVVRTPQPQ